MYIFCYLASTMHLALYFNNNNESILLKGYRVTDYVGDITNQKSLTNTLLFLNGSIVH